MTYRVGDRVIQKQRILSNATKHIAAKLVDKFRGPLVVIKIVSPLVYELEDPISHKKFTSAVIDLKPFRERENFV